MYPFAMPRVKGGLSRERLSKKVDGVWTASCKYGDPPYPVVTQEIIDRLAAYEDTGLAPEEVQIQKEAMERMGWFGKMFQRYVGDPRGLIGTFGSAAGKFLVEFCIATARNRQAIKDVDGNTWLPMLQDEFRAMADFIERVQGWIPVEERLPEEGKRCLLYTPCDRILCVGYYAGKDERQHRHKWRLVTAMRSTQTLTKKVTHWLPLPKAPKEEKKND